MALDANVIRTAIVDHVDGFFTRHRKELLKLATPPEGRVIRLHLPDNPIEPWSHLTLGAWEATSASGSGVEFLLLAAWPSDEHVETLAAVWKQHAEKALGYGDVIALGRGWIQGSPCDHLLLTLPYPYGANLEHVASPGFPVRILWLVPITAAEAAFAREKGREALEQRLQAGAVDFLAEQRASVV